LPKKPDIGLQSKPIAAEMKPDSMPDLENWVEEFTGGLYSWALHKTSDAELANDMVQDTFMAAAEKINSFRGDSSPKTFLFSILNHKIIDHYRKKINKPISMEDQQLSTFFGSEGDWVNDKRPSEWNEDESSLLDDEDFQLVLNNCIEDLPEKWNACVTSKYLMDKKTEEICQELGISTTNYWQMMHRAKLQLRECIENNWFQK
jgi:RNA polymerase sigma-70 factor (TIGR02943 family)